MTCTGCLIALGALGWAGLALGIVGMAGVMLTLVFAARNATRRRGETWHGYGHSAWSGDTGSGNTSPAAGSDGRDCADGHSDGGGDCSGGDGGGGDGGGGGGSD